MPNIVRRTLLAAAVTATMIPMGFAAEAPESASSADAEARPGSSPKRAS